jgi:hypothetical protein
MRPASFPHGGYTVPGRRALVPEGRGTVPDGAAAVPARHETVPAQRVTVPGRHGLVAGWRKGVPAPPGLVPRPLQAVAARDGGGAAGPTGVAPGQATAAGCHSARHRHRVILVQGVGAEAGDASGLPFSTT